MTAFGGEIHPLASRWPMLPADELAALAENIAEHGLRDPVMLDAAGRLVDGRNRLAACDLADVEPRFEQDTELNSDERIAAYINTKNAHRRNVATGQKAMAVAEQLALEGKRKNGRWERGSINEASRLSDDKAWAKAMEHAGLVLDYAPELADQVIGGEVTLNEAATEAEQKRTEADRRAEARRQRKEQLAKLKKLRPDLADKVDQGDLSADDALKVIADELAAEQKAERDRLGWIEKLCMSLVEAIDNAETVAHDNNRQTLIEGWAENPKLRPPMSKHLTAADIRQAADRLNRIADEWSN